MTEKIISIDLPTNQNGHLPRQCPHCEQRFSIHGETYEEEHYLNLRCPYCGMIEEFDGFLTEEQAEYSQVTSQNEAIEMAAREVEDAIKDAFGSSTSGSIDFDEQKTPSPHLPFEPEHLSCSDCAFRYGVKDGDGEMLCPVCR